MERASAGFNNQNRAQLLNKGNAKGSAFLLLLLCGRSWRNFLLPDPRLSLWNHDDENNEKVQRLSEKAVLSRNVPDLFVGSGLAVPTLIIIWISEFVCVKFIILLVFVFCTFRKGFSSSLRSLGSGIAKMAFHHCHSGCIYVGERNESAYFLQKSRELLLFNADWLRQPLDV